MLGFLRRLVGVRKKSDPRELLGLVQAVESSVVKLDDCLLEILERYAKRKNLIKSEVIRRVLRQYFTSSQERPFVTHRIRIYS